MQEVRKFLIHNDNGEYGHLYYYDNEDRFKVVFKHNLDRKKLPALISVPLSVDRYVLDDYLATEWVRQRVFSPNRCDVQFLLEAVGITKYNEADILMKSRGICGMDNLIIDYEGNVSEEDVIEYE